jgi:predicted lactoylglutathione lyase
MKKKTVLIIGFLISFGLRFYMNILVSNKNGNNIVIKQEKDKNNIKKEGNMKLGAFSMSLSVKDIQVSQQFYENLGFSVFAGSLEKNYLIMKNENSLIGLFQGMFKNNILTFNPGWDENANNIAKFDDVRVIQQELKSKGFKIDPEVDEKTSGPAGFMVTDPDGNVILIDQHR